MRIVVNGQNPKGTISRHIYGHFAEHLGRCIYGGIWVGEDSPIPNIGGIRSDVVEALRRIRIPNLRWPGGCFADEYHWQDGIGPRENRPSMINTNWGGVTENNHFGTHEFLRLCDLLDCEPYICGNVGSGTVQEMSQWVEYLNSGNVSPMTERRKANGRDKPWGVKYFGVGNENWGCGGNMRPEYYADVYRRYACYCRNYGDNKLYRIACGSNDFNYQWTEVLMREAGRHMDGLSLHYYTIPTGLWADKGNSRGFSEDQFFSALQRALKIDEVITGHSTVMDKYDPERRVGMIFDEWGVWLNVEEGTNPGFLYQQNSMRDALIASVTLDIFNRHCRRVHMANLAQTINVLQSVILTEGAKMVLTPTYHVFDLYKDHQDAELLDWYGDVGTCSIGDQKIPALSLTPSRKDGKVHITVSNLDVSREQTVEIELRDLAKIDKVSARILTSGKYDDCNTFETPDVVVTRDLPVSVKAGIVRVVLPKHSVAQITVG